MSVCVLLFQYLNAVLAFSTIQFVVLDYCQHCQLVRPIVPRNSARI
jgi:hypothetical protein